MLICQVGILPPALISSESSHGKGLIRKGGNVLSGYRTPYKVDKHIGETQSGIHNPTHLGSFLFKVTATSAKSVQPSPSLRVRATGSSLLRPPTFYGICPGPPFGLISHSSSLCSPYSRHRGLLSVPWPSCVHSHLCPAALAVSSASNPLLPYLHMAGSFIWCRSFLQCHLLREAFQDCRV